MTINDIIVGAAAVVGLAEFGSVACCPEAPAEDDGEGEGEGEGEGVGVGAPGAPTVSGEVAWLGLAAVNRRLAGIWAVAPRHMRYCVWDVDVGVDSCVVRLPAAVDVIVSCELNGEALAPLGSPSGADGYVVLCDTPDIDGKLCRTVQILWPQGGVLRVGGYSRFAPLSGGDATGDATLDHILSLGLVADFFQHAQQLDMMRLAQKEYGEALAAWLAREAAGAAVDYVSLPSGSFYGD